MKDKIDFLKVFYYGKFVKKMHKNAYISKKIKSDIQKFISKISFICVFTFVQKSDPIQWSGPLKMTYIDHLHEETKMLPVQDHLSLTISHRVAPYPSSGILPHSDYGATIKSLHTRVVSNSKSLPSIDPFSIRTWNSP